MGQAQRQSHTSTIRSPLGSSSTQIPKGVTSKVHQDVVSLHMYSFRWTSTCAAMPTPALAKDRWVKRSDQVEHEARTGLSSVEVGDRPIGADLPFAAQMAILRNSTPSCERKRPAALSPALTYSECCLGSGCSAQPSSARQRRCQPDRGTSSATCVR